MVSGTEIDTVKDMWWRKVSGTKIDTVRDMWWRGRSASEARRCDDGVTAMNRTRNSKGLDSKTSTRHDDAD